MSDESAGYAMPAFKPALTPEWDRQVLRSATEQRRFIDEVKTRLARWAQDE